MSPEEQIAFHQALMRGALERLETCPDREQSFVLWEVGHDAQEIALLHLRLSNPREARLRLEEAGEWYLKSVVTARHHGPHAEETELVETWEGSDRVEERTLVRVTNTELSSAIALMRVAPLVGDELLGRAAAQVEDIVASKDEHLLALYVRAVAKLALGKEEEARTILGEMGPLEGRRGRSISGWTRGTSDILRALLERDEEAFVEGLSNALRSFARRVSATGDPPAFLQGLEWVGHARRRGMEIRLERIPEQLRKYLPWIWDEDGQDVRGPRTGGPSEGRNPPQNPWEGQPVPDRVKPEKPARSAQERGTASSGPRKGRYVPGPQDFREAAESFANHVRNDLGVNLDYSPESLGPLEDLFGEWFRADVHVKPDYGLGLGAYLGEVVIRNLGGRWKGSSQWSDFAVEDIGPVEALRVVLTAADYVGTKGGSGSLADWYREVEEHVARGTPPDRSPRERAEAFASRYASRTRLMRGMDSSERAARLWLAGDEALQAAINFAWAGDLAAAREWYGRAAGKALEALEARRKGQEVPEPVEAAYWGTLAALLSRDMKLNRALAREVLYVSAEAKTFRLTASQALASVLLGETRLARKRVADLTDYETEGALDLADALEALLSKDQEALAEALMRMLSHFEVAVEGGEMPVPVEDLALLELARERGMVVDPEKDLLPSQARLIRPYFGP